MDGQSPDIRQRIITLPWVDIRDVASTDRQCRYWSRCDSGPATLDPVSMLGFARLFHGMQAQLATVPLAEPGMTKRKCLQCLFHSIGELDPDAEFIARAEEWARRQ